MKVSITFKNLTISKDIDIDEKYFNYSDEELLKEITEHLNKLGFTVSY